jgi:hypothetical protein
LRQFRGWLFIANPRAVRAALYPAFLNPRRANTNALSRPCGDDPSAVCRAFDDHMMIDEGASANLLTICPDPGEASIVQIERTLSAAISGDILRSPNSRLE